MSEDLNKQIAEEMAKIQTEEPEAPETSSEESSESQPQYSEIEQKAIEMGWKPDHKGPSYVSAKEFVERGSFFRKIDAQNKKIDELLGVVKGLSDHNAKIAAASYQKGVEDALAKRREAVELGDVQAFNQAEAELKKLETVKPVGNPPAQANNNVVTQDMLDWVKENESWFNNNSKENERMVKEADGLYYLESQDNPHKSQKEILEVVKTKIMALHPDKFENPNKSKPIAVTKGSSASTSSKSGLASRLTETQKTFYKQAKNAGLQMSIEEYAKQLDLSGDLKND